MLTDRTEIHRRALLATARIAFVATAAGCQAHESLSPDRDRAAGSPPVADAPSVAAPPVTTVTVPVLATATGTAGCEHGAVAAPAPTPAPTLARATPPAPSSGLGDPVGCTAAAREVTAGRAKVTPQLVACCDAVVAAAESGQGIGIGATYDYFDCCYLPGKPSHRGVCSPWGPPAPPRMPIGWA